MSTISSATVNCPWLAELWWDNLASLRRCRSLWDTSARAVTCCDCFLQVHRWFSIISACSAIYRWSALPRTSHTAITRGKFLLAIIEKNKLHGWYSQVHAMRSGDLSCTNTSVWSCTLLASSSWSTQTSKQHLQNTLGFKLYIVSGGRGYLEA